MATGCSGTNAVRYGTAKGEWFLNAVRASVTVLLDRLFSISVPWQTVVLPSGDVIKTRQRARKSYVNETKIHSPIPHLPVDLLDST